MGQIKFKLKGKVKWWDSKKGFGFIVSGNLDYFVHFNDLKDIKALKDGDNVLFYAEEVKKGKKALEVELLELCGNK